MDILWDYLTFDFADALSTLAPIILALVVSLSMGILIYYVYKRTFRGVVYNESFALTIAAMTVITTMITQAISSNIALSLGMVGALSIVRYRAAIKDPMDILFLFWAVGTGITVGAKLHYLALVGSLILIFLFTILNRKASSDDIYILIVHYSGDDIGDELRRILRRMRYQIKSKTIRKSDVELAVEVVIKKNNTSFMDTIKDLPPVTDVSLIQYSGQYNG